VAALHQIFHVNIAFASAQQCRVINCDGNESDDDPASMKQLLGLKKLDLLVANVMCGE
jgi:hypothetical protein